MPNYNSIDEEIEALNREIEALEKSIEGDTWHSVKETENDIRDLRREIARLEEMRTKQSAAPVSQPKPVPKEDSADITELKNKRATILAAIERIDRNLESSEQNLSIAGYDEEFYTQAKHDHDKLAQESIDLERQLAFIDSLLQKAK